MSGRTPPQRLRLPLLDRLMDDRPDRLEEEPLKLSEAVDRLRLSVRRDLEALLNARRRRWPLPARAPELALSPLGYGIPDATAGSYALPERREALALEVERMIRRFEPRLHAVKVTLREGGDELDRTLRLRVDALLHAEPISFETLIEAVSHEVRVAERG